MRKILGTALGLLIILFLGIAGIVSIRMVYLMHEQQEALSELGGLVGQAEIDLRKAEMGIWLALAGKAPDAIQDAMHRLRQAERSFDQARNLSFSKNLSDMAISGADGVRSLYKAVSDMLPLHEGLYRASSREYEVALRTRLAKLADIMAQKPSQSGMKQLGVIQSAMLDLQNPREQEDALNKLGEAINNLPLALNSDESKKIYGDLQKDFIRLRDEIMMQGELGGRLQKGQAAFEGDTEKLYELITSYRTTSHDLGQAMFLSESRVRQPLLISMLVAAALQILLVLLLLRRNKKSL